MTEDEIKRWKQLIDKISADIAYYDREEMLADHDEDAYSMGQSAHVLRRVRDDIHNILHGIIADEYQERMEKDIASMEQGLGGE